jgi:hypothetical protein
MYCTGVLVAATNWGSMCHYPKLMKQPQVQLSSAVSSCRLKFHTGVSDNSLKLQSFELVPSRAVSDIVAVCLHMIANAHNITGYSLPRHHVHHSQRGYHKSPTCQPAHVQATRLIHLWAPLSQTGSPSHSPLRAYPHKRNAYIQCHKHTEQHKAHRKPSDGKQNVVVYI